MRRKITFKKIVKQKQIYGKQYRIFDMHLYVDGERFDVYSTTKENKAIQDAIRYRYWKTLKKFYLSEHVLVARISGLHFYLEDIRKYIYLQGNWPEMILHIYDWKTREGGHRENKYAIVKISKEFKKLFRQMFYDLWFALDFKLQFEGIVLPPDKVPEILKWSRRIGDDKTYNDLMQISPLVFDNLENGFHFGVTSNEGYSKFVDTCLSELQRGFEVRI